MRKAVKSALQNIDTDLANESKVVLAGLANVYTFYVTTEEEYQAQVLISYLLGVYT